MVRCLLLTRDEENVFPRIPADEAHLDEPEGGRNFVEEMGPKRKNDTVVLESKKLYRALMA